jgi:PncC family amidohydrolase
MAEKALQRSASDYSLALSGIAGPGGGSPEKPAGTVWIGLGKRVAGQTSVMTERFLLSGDRSMIRLRAAQAALNMLRLELLEREEKQTSNAERRMSEEEK